MSIGVEDQEQEIGFSPGPPITASVDDSGPKKEEEEGDHIDFVATETEQDAFDNLGFLSDEDKEEIDSVDDVEEIFYLGDEEIGTKLELAYAYQKMGDVEGAIEILQEVIKEGNREQVKEAEELVSSFDAKLD
jgi:pilus assembly protein FimV